MPNEEVHIGDDWYLGENNNGDLIFYNSRKNEVVKAIDVITGAEDKKGNSINNVSTPLTRNDTGAFLSQAGSSTWQNRTYETFEIIDTPITYTINGDSGSGGDYNSIVDAANDLRGLILQEDVTIEMLSSESISTQASFKDIISLGGKLNFDLNSKTLTLNSVDHCLQILGPINVSFDFTGTIAVGTGLTGYTAVYLANCNVFINKLTFDGQGNSCQEGIYYIGPGGAVRIYGLTYLNNTNITFEYQCISGVTHSRDDPPTINVLQGGVISLANGNLMTTGGTEVVP